MYFVRLWVLSFCDWAPWVWGGGGLTCLSVPVPPAWGQLHHSHSYTPQEWVIVADSLPWSSRWFWESVALDLSCLGRGAWGLQSVGSQRVGHDGTQTIVLFKLLEKPPYRFPQRLHQFTVHQPCTRVSFSPHPHPNLQVLADFVILICISLMICNVEHLFNCISSLEKNVY